MKQLAKKLTDEGLDKKQILIINFEDPRFTQLDSTLLQRIYETYLESLNPEDKPYIFLDEIQEVENWEKWVRMMHELGKAKIIVSDSNAKLLSKELSTLLTGRHIDLTVFPLSFREFLFFNGIEVKEELDIISKKIEINRLLKEYFEFGSFPEVILNPEKEQILLSYFDDIVNKDLVRRYRIRKPEKLKSLVMFYLSNISSQTTFNALRKYLSISTSTAEKFSNYLETVYLTFFLKRFSFKFKEQEKSPRKVYSIDTGLSNTIGLRFSQNIGKIAENLVFLELLRKKITNPKIELYYWKNERHQEADFVIKDGIIIEKLIQVCWDINKLNTKKRETGSLIKGLEELKLSEGLIITEEYE
ncbi:MAG: ATP-binding protein, partial [Candidatus Hydromicrobium sp.]